MNKIYNFFFKNIVAKITCVVLALGLWIYVGTGLTKNETFPGNIPLQIKNVSSGLVPVTDTDTITVKVMAESSVFQRLSADSFTAYIDMSDLKQGTYTLKPQVSCNVSGVSIVETNPTQVVVNLEPSISKDVPVSVLVSGKAGDGLVAGQTVSDPSSVSVSGASSVVTGIIQATAQITLSGQTADFKQITKLVALDSKGKEIKNLVFSPAQVIVTVPIVKASNVKTVGIKVNIVGTPSDGYWVSEVDTDPKTVTVTAAEQTINQISYVPTASVSVANLSKNTTVQTTLAPQSGVSILDNVTSIKVVISISVNQTSKQISVGFKAQGIAANLKVTSYDPTTVSVVVTGPQDIIKSLNPSDISIVVDLSGLNSAGTYPVDISRSNISGPTGVSISSVVPSAINVRLDTK